MKGFISLLMILLMNNFVQSQSYINYVLGKYSGTVYRSGCPNVSTVNGVLYLAPDGNYSNCVGEGDSSSFGQLGEPWSIIVNSDSTLFHYNGSTQDSIVAKGRLLKNDSIHLFVEVFGATFCNRVFDGFKLYSTAGVEDFGTQKTGLIVSPNPANDFVYVQNVNAGIKEKPTLYDINGKGLSIETDYINSTAYKMDVSKLSNGIYFMRCKTGTGFENKKVIVQH